jgi:NADPH:quinone reductase-like Zn-dependent oxidoreductase
VVLDGSLGDEQAAPDLPVGQAVRDQTGDLGFPLGKRRASADVRSLEGTLGRLAEGQADRSGTLAVQYAKRLGARVTGVCSTRNVDLVRSLGADDVLDYTRVDAPPSGAAYDVVLDSVGGAKTSRLKDACKQSLAPGGRYVSIDDGDLELSSARLEQLTGLVESGALTPVVGATYSLDDIVDAHRAVEGGHKRGGVAVTIG